MLHKDDTPLLLKCKDMQHTISLYITCQYNIAHRAYKVYIFDFGRAFHNWAVAYRLLRNNRTHVQKFEIFTALHFAPIIGRYDYCYDLFSNAQCWMFKTWSEVFSTLHTRTLCVRRGNLNHKARRVFSNRFFLPEHDGITWDAEVSHHGIRRQTWHKSHAACK